MTENTCPICGGGSLVRGEGKLEQSGDSYLPTVVWSCALCEYKRFEPAAAGARWRPAGDPAAGDAHEPVAAAHRQAA